MAKCQFCDKGVTFGIKVSHSHRRSNRAWKPNVKRVKAIVDGTPAMYMFVPGVCVPAKSPVLSDIDMQNGCAVLFRTAHFFRKRARIMARIMV